MQHILDDKNEVVHFVSRQNKEDSKNVLIEEYEL